VRREAAAAVHRMLADDDDPERLSADRAPWLARQVRPPHDPDVSWQLLHQDVRLAMAVVVRVVEDDPVNPELVRRLADRLHVGGDGPAAHFLPQIGAVVHRLPVLG